MVSTDRPSGSWLISTICIERLRRDNGHHGCYRQIKGHSDERGLQGWQQVVFGALDPVMNSLVMENIYHEAHEVHENEFPVQAAESVFIIFTPPLTGGARGG